MSYNIDTFKVKMLKGLMIPVNAFYKCERKDWHPDRIEHEDGSTTFLSLESGITGKIVDGVLEVSKIDCSGEGSGTTMIRIFEPALQESQGGLIASCVWEGGDSINRLIVNDGVVEWEVIDI